MDGSITILGVGFVCGIVSAGVSTIWTYQRTRGLALALFSGIVVLGLCVAVAAYLATAYAWRSG